jgi:uncharacterized protein YuzE
LPLGTTDASVIALAREAVEQVVIERPGRGDVVLDFDAEGRLLGVEIIGATALLRSSVLAAADRI